MQLLKLIVISALIAIGTRSTTWAEAPRPGAIEAQPKYASPAETALRTALMRELKPLLQFKLNAAERAATTQSLKFIGAGKLDDAAVASASITHPAALRLVAWKRLLRAGPLPSVEYARFLQDNPTWPRRDRIRTLYERALLRDGGSAGKIKAYFKTNPPLSGAGYAALASAELSLGNKVQARKLVTHAWCHERFLVRNEDDVRVRFDGLLGERDHKCRLDRLLISSTRNRTIRRSRSDAAKRLLVHLSGPEKRKAKARINAFNGARNVRELAAIVKVPELVKEDWGVAYQRIVRSRRLQDYAHAYTILKSVPGDHARHVNRDEWWDERERHARHWLAKGQVQRAYAIVKDVRPESANPAKEQAFLAGWLALMKLKRPKAARAHFKRMVAHADGPLSKSMSEFWLARAHARAGDKKLAQAHYKASASIRDTFHGLLSKRAAFPDSRSIELPAAQQPTPAEVQRFVNSMPVKALLIGYAVGLPRRDILAFYRMFGRELRSAGELALLAQLASALGDGQGEVRVGKSGVSRGFNLYEFSYPVHRLPDYEPLREPAERALLFAIGRQESEFDTKIVSRAGARGVLQVMPITARHICRQYRIKCNIRDLLSRPSYNARIASAYIADRRDEFGGSYILTLTGFNAGPGRTRQWLRQMGDPRAKGINPLDWIYRIPFLETRLYVRKVLSNVQVYRARLGEKAPLRLDKDLRRGRS